MIKLDPTLPKVVGHLWSKPGQKKKKEERHHGKEQTGKTSHNEEDELEKNRWLKEVQILRLDFSLTLKKSPHRLSFYH